jgi:predicted DCC family thiol-disulfide oxidoreductase YuxK
MPDRPLLLYDGGCRFCRWAARLVAALDWKRKLAFLPFDDAEALPFLAGIPVDERYTSWHLIRTDGRRWSRGVVGGPADAVYTLVASHRDKLGRFVPDRPGPRRPP